MTKISVVMPVYNTKEEYLRKAIESILNQTYTDFEFIIVNDGSTNNAEEVIKSYTDNRIVYISQENQGVANSLNNGIKQAKGEYIARMDSDDISLPERFAKEVDFLDKNPEYSLVGTGFEVFPRGEKSYFVENPKVFDFILGCQLAHPTVMFRKDDFAKHNLYYDPECVAEDYNLWCRAIKKLNVHNLPEVLLMYRVEGQGTSSQKRERMIKATIKEQQSLLDFLTTDKNAQQYLIDLAYKNCKIGKNFKEQIFSIKNFYKFNKKYKVLTILGFEIHILVKTY